MRGEYIMRYCEHVLIEKPETWGKWIYLGRVENQAALLALTEAQSGCLHRGGFATIDYEFTRPTGFGMQVVKRQEQLVKLAR